MAQTWIRAFVKKKEGQSNSVRLTSCDSDVTTRKKQVEEAIALEPSIGSDRHEIARFL